MHQSPRVHLSYLVVVLALGACADGGVDSGATQDAGADLGEPDTSRTDVIDDGVDDTTDPADATDAADAGDAPDLPEAPDAGDPRPIVNPGPWYVGYRQLETTYQPPGFDEPRTLRLAVWYPTPDTTGARSFYRDLLPRDGIWADASAAPGPFPVLMFSHGSTAFAEQSVFLTEFMASHGWLVVAPDHTGNTLFDDSPGPLPPALFELRPQDISAALDHIQNLPDDDPLHAVAGAPIAAAGHSFGGYTMLALGGASFAIDALVESCMDDFDVDVCEYITPEVIARLEPGLRDHRIEAIVPMAPGGYAAFQQGVADIDVPVLLMTGGVDTFTPDAEEGDPIWAGLDGPNDIRIAMATAGHFTFSDACRLSLPVPNNDSCGPENIDTAEVHPILAGFVLSFVTGDYGAFDAPSPHPAVDIFHKETR